MNFILKKHNRKLSLSLALVLLTCVCLSVFFIHGEFDHACSGEDCPVCAVINIIRTNLQNLDIGPDFSLQIERFSIIELSVFVTAVIFILKTPVSEKIKLTI